MSGLHIINVLQHSHHFDSFMCDPVAWLFCVNLYISFSPLCMLSIQLSSTLCDPVDPSGFSVHGFSQQEYWSGLPHPTSGDLPDPRIKLALPVLQEDFYAELPGKPSFSPLFEWNSDCLVSLNVGHYWILVSINQIRQVARGAPFRTLRAEGHLCLIWHIIF